MKKYLAEMLGTMVLVIIGCGTAISVGCDASNPSTVVATSIAFGVAVVAMAYTIGGISGCHINPAVTLSCLICGRINIKDAGAYVIFQIIGAILGSAILYALVTIGDIQVYTTSTGANACATDLSIAGGLIAEIIFTFIFTLVVLGTTDSKKGADKFAGLAIGLSLMIVHLACIRYTGTSVNPARSIGPAIFEGGASLSQLWIFIVGPLLGATISACTWNVIKD